MKLISQTQRAWVRLRIEVAASLLMSTVVVAVLYMVSQPVGQALIAQSMSA